MTIKEGEQAPDFSLPADNENNVSLSELKGKNVVLYFYPKDNTPGCTQEAKDFRDAKADFEAANTIIIGLSKDSLNSHDKFKSKYELNFALASDENNTTVEDYGAWVEKNMYGKKYMGIERSTFLIDKAGNLAKVWRKVKVNGHVQEVLEEARKLS